jgi:transposase
METDKKLTADEARRRFLKGDLTPDDLTGDRELLAAFMILMRQHIDQLNGRVNDLSRHAFGRRSERFNDPNQLNLFESQLEELLHKTINKDRELANKNSKKAAKPKSKGHGRQPLPKDLPRVKKTNELPEEERVCPNCQESMTEIGRETTERLCRIQLSFVHQVEQVKYACQTCHDGVLTAEPPTPLVDRGLFDRSFLAHIVVSKFQDHLPLYRQVEMLRREGLSLATSTLCDQVRWMAEQLAPIHNQIGREILERPWVQVDETPVVTVKGKGKGKKSKKTYLWVYRSGPGLIYFDWTADRKSEHPLRVLDTFQGYVQTDDYVGYDQLFQRTKITEVGCLAHARRYFDKALDNHKDYARLVLRLIQLLYHIERELPDGEEHAAERKQLRQEKAVPILTQLRDWLKDHKDLVVPSSAIGKAINHMGNRWEALTRYTEDGRLHIDNNLAENAIRPIAVGRKNWLQIGSEEGGRRAATLMSLVGCCRSLKIDPHLYIWDVIDRLSRCPASQIHDLTPQGWQERYMDEAKEEYAAWRATMTAALATEQ